MVSTEPDVWYIPGDELSFEVPAFEHEQHIWGVRVVFAHEGATSRELWLEGDRVEAAPPRRESPQKVIYTSRATVEAVISEGLPAGRYWRQRVEAYTYGEQYVGISVTAKSTQLPLPTYLQIQPEPRTAPRFL